MLEYVTFDGKRIRPILALSLVEEFNKKEDLVNSAVAIEFLHVSSLIHDDLPAIDNDDYRRGKLACHKMFSESQAILGANYLTAVAFKIADPRFIPYLSASFMDLNFGQILDLDLEERKINLERIHKLKTGALFSTCFSLAGIAGKFDRRLQSDFTNLGNEFGVIFQYYNDFIDLHGDAKLTGRNEGSDQKNNRVGIFNEDKNNSKLILSHKFKQYKEKLELFQEVEELNLGQLFEVLQLLEDKIRS